MLGDGKTAYDHAHDGDANSIGACSVRIPFLSSLGQPILIISNGRAGDGPTHELDYQVENYICERLVSRRKSQVHRSHTRHDSLDVRSKFITEPVRTCGPCVIEC